ncbi:MAG TPA: hypothetical protein VOA80_07420 [Thermoanaerobaculia bacterium]|nr:hypothetical protein [Thermoanaerobaculia bacterium]
MTEKDRPGKGFVSTIKPYFTELDRTQMLSSSHTSGYTVDLWDASAVQSHFSAILKAVHSGRMPPAGAGSDGPWSATKIAQFVSDFNEWRDAGYQP